MTIRSKQLQKLIERGRLGNPLDRLNDIEQSMRASFYNPLQVDRLDQISQDLGIQIAGEFISPAPSATSADPTNVGFTGSAQGGYGWAFLNNTWNWVVVKKGILSVGASIDGDFLAAQGEYTINEDGTLSSGLTFLHRFTADYGGYTRQGYIGMLVPDGGTKPSMRIYFQEPAATNLVVNGSFDAGDETSWTDTNTSWDVAADATYGYAATHDKTDVGCPPTLTQNVAVSPSVQYSFTWASKVTSGYFKPKVELVWLNAGAGVIRTDTIIGNSGAAWAEQTNIITSPALTASVTIKAYPGEIFTAAVVSGFSLYALTAFSAIDFYDSKMLFDAYPGKPTNPFGLPESCVVTSLEWVASATVVTTVSNVNKFNFYSGPSAVNAANGDTYTFSFVLAAGTYTLTVNGRTTIDSGIVDYYLDDVLISSSEDWYSLLTVENVSKTQSVTIAVGGRHTLKTIVNGTTGTDYRWLISHIKFTKSAYTVEA